MSIAHWACCVVAAMPSPTPPPALSKTLCPTLNTSSARCAQPWTKGDGAACAAKEAAGCWCCLPNIMQECWSKHQGTSHQHHQLADLLCCSPAEPWLCPLCGNENGAANLISACMASSSHLSWCSTNSCSDILEELAWCGCSCSCCRSSSSITCRAVPWVLFSEKLVGTSWICDGISVLPRQQGKLQHCSFLVNTHRCSNGHVSTMTLP